MKRLFRVLLSFVMVIFCFGNHTVYAEDQTTVTVTSISKPTEVTQGSTDCGVNFEFTISKTVAGSSFTTGEQIEIATNLGELFDATWTDFSGIQIKGSSGELLATVALSADKVTVTVEDGANGVESFSGAITSVNKLTAKNVGASETNPSVTKQLTIGDKTVGVTFKWTKPYAPEDGANLSAVDITECWKNAWAIQNNTGATTSIEVNPIGSMDLYATYTWPSGVRPSGNLSSRTYENLLIVDEIQDQGYIDVNSLKIYAVVPALAVRTTDANFNGYQVPAGTYYAARQGTMRYRIDQATADDSGRALLTRVTQNYGETYAEFQTRVVSEKLQWGI